MKKLFFVFLFCEVLFSHDLWLTAKKNGSNTIKIIPVISENFPKIEEIKNYSRFYDLKLFNEKNQIQFESDSLNFCNTKTSSSQIFSCKVLARNLTFSTKIANHYLKDEIGLSKPEIMELLKNQSDSITENYRRNLKIIFFDTLNEKNISDFYTGLEKEIIVTNFKVAKNNSSTITIKLVEQNNPIAQKKIRILSGKNTQFVVTDNNGEATLTIKNNFPLLFTYIDFWKESDGNFKSIWTNLSLVKLK